jgi:hypothetical protein
MFQMEIKTSLSKYLSVVFLITSLILLSAGCQKKAEKPEGENMMKDTTNTEQPKTDTTAMAETTNYPDLIGTWTGTFESHGATFKVTEQDGGDFKASLTVAYRQPMNKSISGVIDPATKKITMKDDVKSRNEAAYTAELSDNGDKISGTSTLKVGGNKAGFTFKKK